MDTRIIPNGTTMARPRSINTAIYCANCDCSSMWERVGERRKNSTNKQELGAPGHCDKQKCIISAGTPDLSGRALHHADPLPHECGVPLQCSGASTEIQEATGAQG